MTASLVLQLLGTSASIAGALLNVWKRRGCWIAYSVSNVAFVALFLVEGLYVPIIQYAFFMTINVIGWREWSKGRKP